MNLASNINSIRPGMGTSVSPGNLPPGLSGLASLIGSAPGTGEPPKAFPPIAGKAKGFGSKGPENPSFNRASAISRRLNGKPSRPKEAKGL